MEQTLHEFVLNLLTDPQSLAAFAADPQGALGGAGLSDISAADVQEVVPLVADYAPMQVPGGLPAAPAALPVDSLQGGQAGAIAQLQQVAETLGGQFSLPQMPQSASSDGFTMANSYTNALGTSAFSAAGTPDGHFAGSGAFADAQGDFAAAGSLAGGMTEGLTGGSNLASPLGDGAFSATGSPAGSFAAGNSFDSETFDSHGAGALAGSLDDGFSGGMTASNPLGDLGFSGAGTNDGHFASNGSFSSPLGNEGTLAMSGSPADGLDISSSYTSPADGLGNFSLSTPGIPGADSMPSLGSNSPLSAQSLSQGSDTLASALANPAAAGMPNPVDALSALAGQAPALPTPGDLPTQLPGNVPGALPVPDAGAAPQSAPQHAVNDAVSQVGQHAAGAGLPDVTNHLPAGDPSQAVQHAASNAIDQVSQHAAGAGLPDVTNHLPAGDPSGALQSGLDQAQQGLQHAASHSPLAGVAGNAPSLDDASHALEQHHSVDESHHADGNGAMDLHF